MLRCRPIQFNTYPMNYSDRNRREWFPSPRAMMATDLVAQAANGANERAVGAGINLAPQVIDIHVHDVGQRVAMHPPNLFHDAGSWHRHARVSQKEFQESVLFRAEVDGAASAANFVRNAVDFQIFEHEYIANGPILAT